MKEDIKQLVDVEELLTYELEFEKGDIDQLKAGRGVPKGLSVGEENLHVFVGTSDYLDSLINERLHYVMDGIKNEIEQNKLSNAELGLAYKIMKYTESLFMGRQ